MKSAAPFLVLEGLDGVGKSTTARALAARLQALGIEVHLTAEPSQGPIGKLLRQILSGKLDVTEAFEGYVPSPTLESLPLLFAADRLEHIRFEVLPRLQRGVWVISDRYYHSSLAYQSLAADFDWVKLLNQRALRPDITFLLLASQEELAARRMARNISREIYDDLETQRALEAAYRELPERLHDETIEIVDASRPVEAVVEDLLQRLTQLPAAVQLRPRRSPDEEGPLL